MAVNEIIVTGRKFRKLIDEATKLWQRISFWTKASDVEFDDGSDAETKFGAINGITDSLTSTSSNVAASATAVKTLNDKITELSSNLSSGSQIGDTYFSGEPNAQGSAGYISETVTLSKGQILVISFKGEHTATIISGNPEITHLVGKANPTSSQSSKDNYITLLLYRAVEDNTQIQFAGGATSWYGVAAALIV